jgi:hypothetical protein
MRRPSPDIAPATPEQIEARSRLAAKLQGETVRRQLQSYQERAALDAKQQAARDTKQRTSVPSGTGALTRAQERELNWFFLFSEGEATRLRSGAGPAIDRRRDNTPRATSPRIAEPSLAQQAATERERGIRDALHGLDENSRRALQRFYGPGNWTAYHAWGRWASLITLTPSVVERADKLKLVLRDPELAAAFSPKFRALGDDALMAWAAGAAAAPLPVTTVRELAKLGAGAFDAKFVRTQFDGPKIREAESLLRAAEIAYRRARTKTPANEKPSRKAPEYRVTLTIREYARRFEISEATVKRRMDAGALEYVLVGRRGQRRVVLRSDRPFPAEIGRETRGRKKSLTVDEP